MTVNPAANQTGAVTITISVTDGNGGVSNEAFTLQVGQLNQPPVITSGAAVSVLENTTAVTTVVATDPNGDTVVYAVNGGADVGKFAINSLTGALSFVTAPDFENPLDANQDNVYEVQVAATDGRGGLGTQLVRVTVTNRAEDAVAPTVQVFDVSPNLRAGSVQQITVLFSEAVTGFDLADLTLTRQTDSQANVSLAAATLTSTDNITWTLGNLTGLTVNSGRYGLTLRQRASGMRRATRWPRAMTTPGSMVLVMQLWTASSTRMTWCACCKRAST